MFSNLFSTPAQLAQIAHILSNYLRLPFSGDTIPGSLMEATLARVRAGKVLPTYDFVDVISSRESLGWQVKSTKSSTPVTWMRAKLPDRGDLIAASEKSGAGRKRLGDAIIHLCNAHALESMRLYHLDSISYARLVVGPDQTVRYFERLLLDKGNPQLFNPDDYKWNWSSQKATQKKEQLTSFFATHIADAEVHFRWHGRGENQLHFTGERHWWPAVDDLHQITFTTPSETQRIDFETLAQWLAQLP